VVEGHSPKKSSHYFAPGVHRSKVGLDLVDLGATGIVCFQYANLLFLLKPFSLLTQAALQGYNSELLPPDLRLGDLKACSVVLVFFTAARGILFGRRASVVVVSLVVAFAVHSRLAAGLCACLDLVKMLTASRGCPGSALFRGGGELVKGALRSTDAPWALPHPACAKRSGPGGDAVRREPAPEGPFALSSSVHAHNPGVSMY
jgi:hypothetical protein